MFQEMTEGTKMENQESQESKLFDIDKLNLDEEWIKQPKLFFTYAEKLVDARKNWEEAKADRDIVAAELDKDIRNNPYQFELTKLTEGAVEKAIILDEEYQNANDKVLKLKHKVDVLQAVVDAFEHRKRALEKLVDLHGQNYFSEPRTSSSISRETLDQLKMDKRKRVKET